VKESDLYANASVAKPYREDFYLCWLDPDTKAVGHVRGEIGTEWTEVHEVSTYFNAECDGLRYYVGNEYCEPLLPSYEEAHRIVKFETQYRLGLTRSDKLALKLLFG
jgi:hypothetical protein